MKSTIRAIRSSEKIKQNEFKWTFLFFNLFFSSKMVTFLLVANMSLWIIYTLIKGRAEFRPTHLDVYGGWAWTVI